MRENLKKYTLLLIENEDDARVKCFLYFKKFFKNVYEANNGDKGYDLYKKYKPEILFINTKLPRMSGLDLAQRIRKEDKNIKIVMISSQTNDTELLRAVELNLSKFLLKPISKKILKELLLKLINDLEDDEEEREKRFYFGNGYIWNQDRLYLTKNGKEIKLTKNEIRLLSLLASSKSKIFSNEDIFAHVWVDNFEKEFSIDSIKTLIKSIRKKIPKEVIINIYGEGYRLNPCIFKN